MPPTRPAVVAARPARLVFACAAVFACTLAAVTPVAQADSPPSRPTATRPAPATPGNLTREEKRCNAGLRRVERHKEKLAETKRTHEATRKAVETCGSPRACERASHRERTLDARARNEERQLARLDAEARDLCAAAKAAQKPR